MGSMHHNLSRIISRLGEKDWQKKRENDEGDAILRKSQGERKDNQQQGKSLNLEERRSL